MSFGRYLEVGRVRWLPSRCARSRHLLWRGSLRGRLRTEHHGDDRGPSSDRSAGSGGGLGRATALRRRRRRLHPPRDRRRLRRVRFSAPPRDRWAIRAQFSVGTQRAQNAGPGGVLLVARLVVSRYEGEAAASYDDVDFLDRYAADHGIGSRSAAVQRAVRLLRTTGLGAAYEDAWRSWDDSGDAALWASTTDDGMG